MIEHIRVIIGKEGFSFRQFSGLFAKKSHPLNGGRKIFPFVGLDVQLSSDLDYDGDIVLDGVVTEYPRLNYRVEPRSEETDPKLTSFMTFYIPRGWKIALTSPLGLGTMLRINHHRQANPEEFGFCLERKIDSDEQRLDFTVTKKSGKHWCTIVFPMKNGQIEEPMFIEDYQERFA